MSEPQSILIASASGRALAATARRSGYRPLVLDFFDDEDTRALAAKTRRIEDPDQGFVADELLALLQDLAEGEEPCGLVYGSGFEDRPDIITAVTKRFFLFGNGAPIVARAKAPQVLACLCAELNIPHPDIAFDKPADLDNWLIKKHGGGGGIHIRAARGSDAAPREYFQRRVAGAPVSVLLLSDGRQSQVVGTSSQWTASTPDRPFRFGGAVRPAQVASELLAKLCAAAQKLAAALRLIGLNSVDFLATGDGFHLLEINPRPGATLDIFADEHGGLLSAHLDACRGHLPRRSLVFTRAAAIAIAYAPCETPSMPALSWPDWCKDRQWPGTFVRAGDPVCTISAEAETAAAARALVNARCASFEDSLLREAHKESVE